MLKELLVIAEKYVFHVPRAKAYYHARQEDSVRERGWVENKEYEYHWYFRFVLWARSRLYRSHILQLNTEYSLESS